MHVTVSVTIDEKSSAKCLKDNYQKALFQVLNIIDVLGHQAVNKIQFLDSEWRNVSIVFYSNKNVCLWPVNTFGTVKMLQF